jgi:hypothetical protein
MTIQERVQDIFNKFNVNLKVEESRTELAEAALDNGTVIYTDGDDFVEGDEAYIINDEGERIPLPPGDYTFKDGGVISIADGGKIAAVNKGGEGKEAKDGKASNPAKTKQPVAEAPAKDAPVKPAPTDPPVKPPTKPKTRQSADFEEEENPNDMEEVTINYVTREEVEAIIAEAIAAAMGEPAVEEAEEEEKEEMSVNPEAPKAEAKEEPQAETQEEAEEPTQEVEVEMSAETPEAEAEKVEAPSDMDVILTELSQVKERLFELQKQAASTGLKHKAPTPKKEPLNLQNLSIEERVRALSNHYNA